MRTTFDNQLMQLNREMIGKNLSPGGCADLPAIVYWLTFLLSEST